jgi:glycosyltransferase involved in cell wall biosynthesis
MSKPITKNQEPSTISVIIPTVNAHEELDLAIASIKKNSDYKIDFCIIVDPDMGTGKINADIIKVCKKHGIKPHLNKKNLGPYGNWNRGAEVAETDWLVFATDDQYFPPHWDRNLVREWQPKRLVSGRLVEPGIIPVYKLNIQKDFGVLPSEFKEDEFNAWCASRTDSGFERDGFFIPMLQHRDDYDALGHYPTAGKFGTSTAVSNDVLYVQEAQKKGYEFGTANDSYSYHFQASSWKKKTLKPTIAAIILTKNEESDLPACLKSLSWATEIIVVDSGSTDKTLEIAKKYKAKVYKNKFENFAAQRNFALSKAAGFDWALMVDADEVVEKGLVKELKSYALDIYLDGVEIPRKNKIFGRWIEHSDWYPDYRLVFTRPKIVTYKGDVHERIEFIKGNGTVARTSSHLLHNNYETVREFVVKNLVEYPEQYAEVLDKEGHKFTASDLLVKPLAEFMRRFFLSQGYKDGLFGLTLSLLMGAQSLVAYAYLWEMQGKRRDLTTDETQEIFRDLRSKGTELTYWLTTIAVENSKGAKKYLHRAKRKALKLAKGI